MSDLRQAAQAVLNRWDSPNWEWKHYGSPRFLPTATLMSALRKALAEQQAEPVAQSDLVKRLRETASKGVSVWGNLQMEAAREIEILRAERDCYASAMDKMLAASRAEPVAWQLIETAPKNGSAILVMRDIWPGTKSGRAEECHGHNTYVAAWWDGENNGRGAWVCYTDSVCEPQCPIEPTHWMPLPCPPSIAPSQQQAEPVAHKRMNDEAG